MNKLQTIIEYAIENGWKPWVSDNEDLSDLNLKHPRHIPQRFNIVFNHDFLKAVFGEHTTSPNRTNQTFLISTAESYQADKAWKHHAQQMVISEDPVDYVYEYVKEQTKD